VVHFLPKVIEKNTKKLVQNFNENEINEKNWCCKKEAFDNSSSLSLSRNFPLSSILSLFCL